MTPLEVAKANLGVKETPPFSNNTKFNTWYYGREVQGSEYPWCMAFVQYCFNESGNALPYKTASCGSLYWWYHSHNRKRIVYDRDTFCGMPKLKPNDIIIFDWKDTKATTDHTGIFEKYEGKYIVTIEGNTSGDNWSDGGCVCRCTRVTDNVRYVIRPFDEEDYMTGEEIYIKLCDYLSKQPLPSWAIKEYQEAINLGITDGNNPMMITPRHQTAIMALRAVKSLDKED